MPSILLPVPLEPQQQDADCLAACAAMILAYLEQPIPYKRLLQLLKVTRYGTPGHNLKNLTTLGLDVRYREGSMDEIKAYLQQGVPCITLVRTADLSYWSYSTDHAVVVVGCDDHTIYVNDPAFETHPQAVSAAEFELAWLEFDYRYAIIIPQA